MKNDTNSSSDLLQESFLERGISEVETKGTQLFFHKIFPPYYLPSGSACPSNNQTTIYCIDNYYHTTTTTNNSIVRSRMFTYVNVYISCQGVSFFDY